MYGGKSSTIQRHPFMAAIWCYETDPICAGTIIGDQWVITTGWCMQGVHITDCVRIVAGSNDFFAGDSYDAEKVIFHPKFSDESMDYQYTLIKVKQPFVWKSTVKAIKLPIEALTKRTKMMVSGWGYTSVEDDALTVQQGKMNWMSKQFCNSSFAQVGFGWTDRMACVYNKGKTTLCDIDYGDPVVHKGVLYGIFAMAYQNDKFCSSLAGPSMLADIFQEVDWIKETMKQE